MDLAFAHFSSELLLKEQMIIPVKKKTFTNAGHIDAKLIDFSEICHKKSTEIGYCLLIVSWRTFSPKFPVKSADFSKNFLLKILRKLTFFLLKSRKIGQFFPEVAPENPAKFCFFFREISEALFLMTHAQAFSLFTKSCI